MLRVVSPFWNWREFWRKTVARNARFILHFSAAKKRAVSVRSYFVDNLAFPKENLVANLQFEMLGRPDAKVGADELWLTGYDRSDLGAELARRGAKLVNDPHPDQNFFQRSDNYTLGAARNHRAHGFEFRTSYRLSPSER